MSDTPRTDAKALARDLRHGSWTAQIEEMLVRAADCIDQLERENAALIEALEYWLPDETEIPWGHKYKWVEHIELLNKRKSA